MSTSTTKTRDSLPGFAGIRHASDEALQAAERAVDRTRVHTNDALDHAEDKIRELHDNVDPMIDALATQAQALARQSLEIAAEAKKKAQQSLSRYANATTQYVSQQPVRSVLIAAAVGAALALLVSASRHRKRH